RLRALLFERRLLRPRGRGWHGRGVTTVLVQQKAGPPDSLRIRRLAVFAFTQNGRSCGAFGRCSRNWGRNRPRLLRQGGEFSGVWTLRVARLFLVELGVEDEPHETEERAGHDQTGLRFARHLF